MQTVVSLLCEGNSWSPLLKSFGGNPEAYESMCSKGEKTLTNGYIWDPWKDLWQWWKTRATMFLWHIIFLSSLPLFQWQWWSVMCFRHTANKFSPNFPLKKQKYLLCIASQSAEREAALVKRMYDTGEALWVLSSSKGSWSSAPSHRKASCTSKTPWGNLCAWVHVLCNL